MRFLWAVQTGLLAKGVTVKIDVDCQGLIASRLTPTRGIGFQLETGGQFPTRQPTLISTVPIREPEIQRRSHQQPHQPGQIRPIDVLRNRPDVQRRVHEGDLHHDANRVGQQRLRVVPPIDPAIDFEDRTDVVLTFVNLSLIHI